MADATPATVPPPSDGSPPPAPLPSLGLEGLWATVANFSAVVLVGVVFVVQSERMWRITLEDRAMFREESRAQWAAAREGQQAISKLATAVEQLADEVKELKAKSGNGKSQ